MQFLIAITLALALASSEQTFLDSASLTGNLQVIGSDSTTWVVGAQSLRGATATSIPLDWLAVIPGANWIWDAKQTEKSTTTFFKTFIVMDLPTKATLDIAADDYVKIWINGVNIGKDITYTSSDTKTQRSLDVTSFLQVGENTLKLEVYNGSGPAGVLYKITIS